MTINDLLNDARFTEVNPNKFDSGDRVFCYRHGPNGKFFHIGIEWHKPFQTRDTTLPEGIEAHAQMTDHNGRVFNIRLLHADEMPFEEFIPWFVNIFNTLQCKPKGDD